MEHIETVRGIRFAWTERDDEILADLSIAAAPGYGPRGTTRLWANTVREWCWETRVGYSVRGEGVGSQAEVALRQAKHEAIVLMYEEKQAELEAEVGRPVAILSGVTGQGRTEVLHLLLQHIHGWRETSGNAARAAEV